MELLIYKIYVFSQHIFPNMILARKKLFCTLVFLKLIFYDGDLSYQYTQPQFHYIFLLFQFFIIKKKMFQVTFCASVQLYKNRLQISRGKTSFFSIAQFPSIETYQTNLRQKRKG